MPENYKYTIGGGLAGLITGLAATKLFEDDDKQADWKDYLIRGGIGLGLGAAGGRILDTAESDDNTPSGSTDIISSGSANRPANDTGKLAGRLTVGVPSTLAGAALLLKPSMLGINFSKAVKKVPVMKKLITRHLEANPTGGWSVRNVVTTVPGSKIKYSIPALATRGLTGVAGLGSLGLGLYELGMAAAGK